MSIQYNVSALLREPVGSTREYEVADDVLIDGAAPHHERVAGHASFLRTKHGVLVPAHLQGVQREQCSRCLQPLEVPVQLDLEEEFFARVDPTTGTSLPPPEEPEAFRIDPHHMLELDEAVRQYWALALPMQPLCRPDCLGLCPRCGRDLNQGACSCQPEADERWSALRELVIEREGS